VGFVYHAVRLMRTEGDGHAMKTFGYSIVYLASLLAFLQVDQSMARPGIGTRHGIHPAHPR
jgi:protoheme IX farnesyltransferase